MQTYPLKLSPGEQTVTIHAQADLFVYESGDAAGGDTRVKVKPENGAEIVLRPGQRFRIVESAQRWTVSLFDPAANLTGYIIIGSGEFDDANTLNTFKLDATFANNVKVTNAGAGQAIPVTAAGTFPVSSATPLTVTPSGGSLPVTIQNAQLEITNDSGNRVPVSLDPAQLIQTVDPIMSYSAQVKVTTVGGTSRTLVTAAQNVNGVVIEQINGSAGAGATLLANAVAPVNKTDGDVLSVIDGLNAGLNAGQFPKRVKIPAGKGGYLWAVGAADYYVLYTVL